MNNIKVFFNLKSSVFQFAIVLTIFSIFSILSNVLTNYDQVFVEKVSISYVTLVIVGIIYTFVSKQFLDDKFLNPNNAIITTSIVFLLLFPLGDNQFLLIPLALVFTFLINKFLRFKNQPIFNPTAIGLTIFFLILEVLFNLGILKENIFISWWGANLFKGVLPYNIFQIIFGVIFAGLFLYFSYFYKKLNLTLTFIFSFLLFTLISSTNSGIAIQDQLLGYLGGSLLFLAFVMLAEPKTSPTNQSHQIIYGILGGLLLFALNSLRARGMLLGFTGSVELIVILIINLAFFFEKNWKSIMKSENNIQTPQSQG